MIVTIANISGKKIHEDSFALYFTLFKVAEIPRDRTKMTILDIFCDYATYSTIQGLTYITLKSQTTTGKVFWICSILFMLTVGCYWCFIAYHNWNIKSGKL